MNELTNVVGAMLRHAWLLITGRHDGTGLPQKSGVTVFLLMFMSSLVYAAKMGDIRTFATMMTFQFVMLFLASPAFVSGAALLYISIDMLSILTGDAFVFGGYDSLNAVELALFLVFVIRKQNACKSCRKP